VDDAIGVATQAEKGKGKKWTEKETRAGKRGKKETCKEEKNARGNIERQSPSPNGSIREHCSSSTLPPERRQANECEKRKGRVEVDREREEEAEKKREGAKGDRLG